jgi:hypothetical protein
MAARCRAAGETPNQGIIDDFTTAYATYERRMTEAIDDGELDSLIEDANLNARLRAYLCPIAEIYKESIGYLDLMIDWGIPEQALSRLAAFSEQYCKNASDNQPAARGLLHEIMREVEVSENFVDQYDRNMDALSRWLLSGVCVSITVSLFSLCLFAKYSLTLPLAILLGGIGGGCASVLSRMPKSEYGSSAASMSMNRQALNRIATGLVGSFAGTGLLAWGLLPVSVNGASFDHIVSECAAGQISGCSPVSALIVVGVAVILGFSERALTKFEDALIG